MNVRKMKKIEKKCKKELHYYLKIAILLNVPKRKKHLEKN